MNTSISCAEQIEPVPALVKTGSPDAPQYAEKPAWQALHGAFARHRCVRLHSVEDTVLAIGYKAPLAVGPILLAMCVLDRCWTPLRCRKQIATPAWLHRKLLEACAKAAQPIPVDFLPVAAWPNSRYPGYDWLDLPTAVAEHLLKFGHLPVIAYESDDPDDLLACCELYDVENVMRWGLGPRAGTIATRGMLTKFSKRCHLAGSPA